MLYVSAWKHSETHAFLWNLPIAWKPPPFFARFAFEGRSPFGRKPLAARR